MSISKRIKSLAKLLFGHFQTLVVLAALFFVVGYFYLGGINGIASNIWLSILALALITDGLFLLLHLPRKKVKHENLSFDPKKLTIVIICYNGQDIIGETIENALVHVKPEQIIVVSDASTDKTVETAQSYGVQVVQNERNVNKAFSISFVMDKVKTPYVLLLDDDTLIGKTFIPTSLLDEGYDAVAFNVMPLETNSLVNKLQRFEYRKSMILGKSIRASVGAIGNVSGAIGLYRTKDLIHQATRHSGQFGGEDQQRTALVHLHTKGKGVTYTDATVITKAPDTIKQLFRQRSFRWNLSLPELFFIYLRILTKPSTHYLLKVEEAYQMYVFLTDPLRMVLFWVILLYPLNALILYCYYLLITSIIWFKIGRQDKYWIVMIYPIYKLLECLCRFIASFYWYKIKYNYLFKKQFHKLVPNRKLVYEYGTVMVLLATLWILSLFRLEDTVNETYKAFAANKPADILLASGSQAENNTATPQVDSDIINTTYHINVQNGDGKTHIARKAIQQYSQEKGIVLTRRQQLVAEDSLQADINQNGLKAGEIINIEQTKIEEHINYALGNQT